MPITELTEVRGYTESTGSDGASVSRTYLIQVECDAKNPDQMQDDVRSKVETKLKEMEDELGIEYEIESTKFTEKEKFNGLFDVTITYKKHRVVKEGVPLEIEPCSYDLSSGVRTFKVESSDKVNAIDTVWNQVKSETPFGPLHVSGISTRTNSLSTRYINVTVHYGAPDTADSTRKYDDIYSTMLGTSLTHKRGSLIPLFEQKYRLNQFTDINSAYQYVKSQYPQKRYSVRVHEQYDELAPEKKVFVAEVSDNGWDPEENNETGKDFPSIFNFDFTTVSQTRIQSLKTLGSYGPSGVSIPSFNGLIGVTSDGVNGVEIGVPAGTFSETHTIPIANVSRAWVRDVQSCVGWTNYSAWRGYEVGELRFDGLSGTRNASEPFVEMTFKFSIQKNQQGLRIGDITYNKPGWAYAWVYYDEAMDSNNTVLVKKPLAVFVEQVMPEFNFQLLGIGRACAPYWGDCAF